MKNEDSKPAGEGIACRVKICDGEAKVTGLCEAHYARLHRYGGLAPRRPIRRRGQPSINSTCRVEICDGEAFAKGLCSAHLRRLRKLGTVLPLIPIKRRVWGARTTHTPEYAAWRNLRYRCNKRGSQSYRNYGSRGIKVCKRWDKFENFLADMGRKPHPRLSIERKNNNRGYSPSNCKWATWKEQANNKRPRSEWSRKV